MSPFNVQITNIQTYNFLKHAVSTDCHQVSACFHPTAINTHWNAKASATFIVAFGVQNSTHICLWRPNDPLTVSVLGIVFTKLISRRQYMSGFEAHFGRSQVLSLARTIYRNNRSTPYSRQVKINASLQMLLWTVKITVYVHQFRVIHVHATSKCFPEEQMY